MKSKKTGEASGKGEIKYVKVLARPGSRMESVNKDEGGRLIICLREPAEDNRANKRILTIVRSMHPGKRVMMVKGHHSPHKVIEIN